MGKIQIARISKIDNERGLILGKDFGNVLKSGVTYELMNIDGVITIKEIGESALQKEGCPSVNSTVRTQVYFGHHLLTKEEKWEIDGKCKKCGRYLGLRDEDAGSVRELERLCYNCCGAKEFIEVDKFHPDIAKSIQDEFDKFNHKNQE